MPHPTNSKSFCLGPQTHENHVDLISCEANRIPFVSQNIDLTSWTDCLTAWPNPPEGWVSWYSRVAKVYLPLWQELNVADKLSLSLSPLEKDENLLKTIGYFWSDALNCFLFGHGPMTPTLLDVVMITGLDIKSSNPVAHSNDNHETSHQDSGSAFLRPVRARHQPGNPLPPRFLH